MTIPHPPHLLRHHFRWGIGYILFSWLFSTLLSPMVRIVNTELSIAPILLAQGFIGMISILPWMIYHGKEAFKTPDWGLLLFRSLCGLLGFLFLFLAIVHTSLVDAYLLNNTAPLFVPFVVYFWMKKPINHKLWIPLMGGFLGIAFILKPSSEMMSRGFIYGLINGMLLSIIMVSLRLLSRTTRNHTVLFYFYVFLTLGALPFTIIAGKIPSGISWVLLIGIGILSSLSQFCLVRAFHHASPLNLGPFNYASVVFAGLLDWALYGVRPDLFAWIGIALVCGGGIWSIRQTIASQHNTPPPASG